MQKFLRMESLIGEDAKKLYNAKVCVIGVGGVGGYVVEALARAGVGTLWLIDGDDIDVTNINRQIIATDKTVDVPKVTAFKERIADINNVAEVRADKVFIGKDNKDILDFSGYDYVVDAVDNVTAKLIIIERAKEQNIPVISAMGAGNKLHAEFVVSDISKSSGCPLARVMRRELRERGINGVTAVYSKDIEENENTERVPASISYVPPMMGLKIAEKVILDILGLSEK